MKINKANIYNIRSLVYSLDSIVNGIKALNACNEIEEIKDVLNEATSELNLPNLIDNKDLMSLSRDVSELSAHLKIETAIADITVDKAMVLSGMGLDLGAANFGKTIKLSKDDITIKFITTNNTAPSYQYYDIVGSIDRPYGTVENKMHMHVYFENFYEFIYNYVKRMYEIRDQLVMPSLADKMLAKLHKETGLQTDVGVEYNTYFAYKMKYSNFTFSAAGYNDYIPVRNNIRKIIKEQKDKYLASKKEVV